MDENYLFYSIYKNQITDIVTLITEIFISVLKLETDQIKSLVFSSDKSGKFLLILLELTLMTVLTLKNLYNKEIVKDILENSRLLKENYKSNKSSLESIVKLLAPLNEEKIRLYYNLIKTISFKEKASESTCVEAISNEKIEKNLNQNVDQFSLRNENISTHCSLSSNNNIVVDSNDQKSIFSEKRPSQGSLNQSFNSGSLFFSSNGESRKLKSNIPSNSSKRSKAKTANSNFTSNITSINNTSFLTNDTSSETDFNLLKQFETHNPSNNFIYQPSTAIYNNINSNIIKDSHMIKQPSAPNERSFHSWGYSNNTHFSQCILSLTLGNNLGSNSDFPDPLRFKEIFKPN